MESRVRPPRADITLHFGIRKARICALSRREESWQSNELSLFIGGEKVLVARNKFRWIRWMDRKKHLFVKMTSDVFPAQLSSDSHAGEDEDCISRHLVNGV